MKKAVFIILVVFLLAACAPLPEVSIRSTGSAVLSVISDAPISEYEYEPVEGGVRITKYNGANLIVTVPEKLDGKLVVGIGEWAFSGLLITEVTLPDSVTSIEWGAFSECAELQKVTLPKNLTAIQKFAFSNCTSLSEMEIPDSVTTIGYGVFSEGSGLERVKLPASLKKIEFVCFAGCKVLKSVEIPDGVTEIEYSAFYKCNKLERITIPASVVAIGEDVFEECNVLTAVCYGDYGAQYCRDNGINYIVG